MARLAGAYSASLRETATVRVAALGHQGDYAAIGVAFDRLIALGTSRGLVGPSTRYFGLFYDDPAGTPEAARRSDACLDLPPGFAPDADLRTLEIAGGRHAVVTHVGPYAELHRAYDWLYRDGCSRVARSPRIARASRNT